MKRIFVLLAVASTALVGCPSSTDDGDDYISHWGYSSSLHSLNDPNFNGTFTRSSSAGYGNKLYTYIFNGTSKVGYSSYQYWKGGSDLHSFEYEWEDSSDISLYPHDPLFPEKGLLSKGVYRNRLWDNHYDDWSEWLPYYFDAAGFHEGYFPDYESEILAEYNHTSYITYARSE